MIGLAVAQLSFLHLGRPQVCPDALRVGTPLNRKQWSAVRALEHTVFGSSFPLTFEPADYPPEEQKVEGQACTLEFLWRAAEGLQTAFGGYFPRPSSVVPSDPDLPPDSFTIVGQLTSKPDIAAMPIVADRIKLQLSSFTMSL